MQCFAAVLPCCRLTLRWQKLLSYHSFAAGIPPLLLPRPAPAPRHTATPPHTHMHMHASRRAPRTRTPSPLWYWATRWTWRAARRGRSRRRRPNRCGGGGAAGGGGGSRGEWVGSSTLQDSLLALRRPSHLGALCTGAVRTLRTAPHSAPVPAPGVRAVVRLQGRHPAL